MHPSTRPLVDRLIQLLGWSGPGTPGVRWKEVESGLGARLPEDFKQLVDAFPAGLFQDYLSLSIPEDRGNGFELLGGLRTVLEDLRAWREDEPDLFPYPIYPEPGGVIPWAGTVHSETVFWLPVRSNPDEWEVVACSGDEMRWDRFHENAVQFVYRVVSGSLNSSVLEGGEPGPPKFTAFPDRRSADTSTRRIAAPEAASSVLSGSANELGLIASVVTDYASDHPRISWPHIERKVSFEFPIDYKECIDLFGAGTFRDLNVAAPGWPSVQFDLFTLIDRVRHRRKGLLSRLVDPSDGLSTSMELLPWGWTGDGLVFYWEASSEEPDAWPVMLGQPGFIAFERLTDRGRILSMTGVIAHYLRNPLSIVDRLVDSEARNVVDPRIPPDCPLFTPAI